MPNTIKTIETDNAMLPTRKFNSYKIYYKRFALYIN